MTNDKPGMPFVRGECPACHQAELFLGEDNYVTCSAENCPYPAAASDLLFGEMGGSTPQNLAAQRIRGEVDLLLDPDAEVSMSVIAGRLIDIADQLEQA